MFEVSLLGLVQGLTEFLPISSSGHLVLIHSLFGFEVVDSAFDVFVQGGTIVSLLVYFAPRLKSLELSRTLFGKLIVGCLPAAIIGILLRDYIDVMFADTKYLALGFLLTTVLLVSTYKKYPQGELTMGKSLLIGLAQAASILPSLSRSGATIATALVTGVKPKEAFNFSFLTSIPLVAGASVLSLNELTWDRSHAPLYIVGFVIATISGYYSLIILDKIIKSGKLYLFAPYTAALTLISLFL